LSSISEPSGVQGTSPDKDVDGLTPTSTGRLALDQDAIDQRIGVERIDQRDQFALGGVGGQAVFEAGHAAGDGLLGLGGDIDLARRVLADQHHGKACLAACSRLERGGGHGDAGAQGFGKQLAVDDFCLAHRFRPGWRDRQG
jgi:hypothetical protein